jgi:hypothetical protein
VLADSASSARPRARRRPKHGAHRGNHASVQEPQAEEEEKKGGFGHHPANHAAPLRSAGCVGEGPSRHLSRHGCSWRLCPFAPPATAPVGFKKRVVCSVSGALRSTATSAWRAGGSAMWRNDGCSPGSVPAPKFGDRSNPREVPNMRVPLILVLVGLMAGGAYAAYKPRRHRRPYTPPLSPAGTPGSRFRSRAKESGESFAPSCPTASSRSQRLSSRPWTLPRNHRSASGGC